MPARLALAISLAAAVLSPAAIPTDYSKEAVVIQEMTTKVTFSSSGARQWQQTLSVRVQSEAAVRQFGVLSFSYSSNSEQIELEYVRVRKPDGSLVETPRSNLMDVATEVATVAPTYSDLRLKQIPVKALGIGDVLEYSVRNQQQKPEVPGQFWYQQTFTDDVVVLSQSLEIRVPKETNVQVSSPKLKSQIREEGDLRIYAWTHSHLEPSKPGDEKKQDETKDEPPKVQLTTFKSWEDVGNWWGALASDQVKLTPAVQAKAKELTEGLSTDSDKAKAIYQYVAMKFRYISISFGAGRYRPHSADEVFANQYGDCKDKHTLFAALLKAVGIQAWPALIGAGIKFDPSIPSPAQFNHVISVLAVGGKYVWLDTTPEVAPFGLLRQAIRDEQALVIPSTGKPFLLKTPVDPPFASSETIDVKSTLAPDGTLTGHFDFRMLGDDAVDMRAGLHQLAPTQWQAFAQQMSYAIGFAGDVSNVDVENLDTLDKSLHYSYDYKRKNYSGLEEHRITPPIPPLGFGPGDDAERPKEPFWAGAPGEQIYRASVQLPKDFSTELPPEASINSEFAEYFARYSFKNGTLFAERKMIIKHSKIKVDEWPQYQEFAKKLRTEQSQFITLSETPGKQSATVSENNSEAQQLVQRAYSSAQTQDLNATRDLLAQAERINPRQAGLWALRAFLEMSSGHEDQAITDYQKEIQYHSEETSAYLALSSLLIRTGRSNDAIELWRNALSRNPADDVGASQAASLMIGAKRYKDALSILEKPIVTLPEKYNLQVLRVQALLLDGEKESGVTEAQKIAKATSDPDILNDLAYYLSDTDASPALGQDLAEKAVGQTEQECAKANLAGFENRDVARVNGLAAQWDTLGWAYFRLGEMAKAEKYVDASWQLSQHADVADHLGQIYDKQGRHDHAVHMWRLALAANKNQEDAKERLRKAGVPIFDTIRVTRNTTKFWPISPDEELGKLRTISVPALPTQTGSAEFFLIVSQHGFEDAQFINGIDSLKNAAHAIQAAKYLFPFPDAAPTKIIRRGILSCSEYTTPSCQITLLLPSTVRKANDIN